VDDLGRWLYYRGRGGHAEDSVQAEPRQRRKVYPVRPVVRKPPPELLRRDLAMVRALHLLFHCVPGWAVPLRSLPRVHHAPDHQAVRDPSVGEGGAGEVGTVGGVSAVPQGRSSPHSFHQNLISRTSPNTFRQNLSR